MSAETSTLAPFDKQVRKLRKKLRQIEKLQLSGRSLNEEETLKVKSRKSIRAELAQLLASTESLETTQPQAFTQNASAKTDLKVLDENLTSSIVKTTVIPDNLKNASFEEPEIKPGKQEVKTAQEATSLTESPTNLSTQEADTEEMKRQTSPSPGIASPSKKSKADAKTSAPAAKAPVPPTKTEPASQKKVEAPEQPAPLQIVDIETETDVLLCVDLDDLHIITGSRDTVVQVRDVATGRLLRDLRGHSNGVTAAVLLSAADSLDLAGRVPSLAGRPAESVRLAVTGSLDCCLKLWNVSDGAAAASIYTYGGITAVAYAAAGRCCLVGHESGKLEAYTFCVDDGVPATHPLYSINAFDDAISSIRIQNEYMVCSSLDGYVGVWTLFADAEAGAEGQPALKPSRRYVSETLLCPSTGRPLALRPVRCLALGPDVGQGLVYYGDEGVNVKVVHWKTGEARKLRNHVHEVGLTRALCSTERLLASTSLDVDTGASWVHLRRLPDQRYLHSLRMDGVSQVMALALWRHPTHCDQWRLAVAGSHLSLIQPATESAAVGRLVRPYVESRLAEPAEDSQDSNDSSQDSDSDEEEAPESADEGRPEPVVSPAGSWCRIL